MNGLRKWIRHRNRPYTYMGVDELISKRRRVGYWIVIDKFMYIVLMLCSFSILWMLVEIGNVSTVDMFTNQVLFYVIVLSMIFMMIEHLVTHRYIDMLMDSNRKQIIALVQYLKEQLEENKEYFKDEDVF